MEKNLRNQFIIHSKVNLLSFERVQLIQMMSILFVLFFHLSEIQQLFSIQDFIVLITFFNTGSIILIMRASKIKPQKKIRRSPTFPKGTRAYAKDRVRRDGRYSVLNTKAMRLLKHYKIYGRSKKMLQNLPIKTQKNYSILLFRLSIAYNRMTLFDKLTQQKAVNKIFSYLQKELEQLTYEKYKKNDEIFKQAAIESSKKGISALKYVFEGDLSVKEQIKSSMYCMFSCNKNGNYTKNQKQSVEKLTEIVFKYSNNFDEHQQTMGMQDGQNQVPDSDSQDDMDEQIQEKQIQSSLQINEEEQNVVGDNDQDINQRGRSDSFDSLIGFIEDVAPVYEEQDSIFGIQRFNDNTIPHGW